MITIRSARFANADNTAIVAETVEAGSVALEAPRSGMAPERVEAWNAAMLLGPAPYEVPPPPDPGVHIAWIEQALVEIGKLDAVEAAVAQDRATQALWRRVTTMRKTDPEVVTIAAALGIDRDALFARAEEIRAARGGSA